MKNTYCILSKKYLTQWTAAFLIGAFGLLSSTSAKAQSTNPSPYCSTSHTSMANNGCQGNYGFNILKVELNGATSNFSCNTGTVYRYYNTSNFTKLKRGVTYTLKVQTASTVYPTSSAGWIDFSGDKSFAQSNEFLGAQLSSNAPTLSYTFTVPGNATPGVTRMRVRCAYYTVIYSTEYCGTVTQGYGETIDFDVEIEQATYPDASIGEFISPISPCGANSDSVVVMVNNYGNATINNLPVTCKITGTMSGNPVNQTLNANITGPINVLGQYRLAFSTPVNTNQVGTLNYSVYTGLATDGDHANDTLKISKSYFGTPNAPSASNVDRCGVGTVPLTCTKQNAADAIRWYDAASGGSFLGAGTSITSPFYVNSTTVYAQPSRNGASSSFAPSTSGTTVYWGGTTNEQGGMMNITPTKTMMIDNIRIRKYYGNTANYKVFIRKGKYQGYESTPSAWTLVGSKNGVTGGAGTMIPINIGGFVLDEGVTYGIYIQCVGDDFWVRYNPSPNYFESNDDMLMENGNYLYGNFTGVVNNYCIDVQWDYTTMCIGNRTPVNVTIKPVPNGTTVKKGSTFNGTYLSGSKQDPDITASGDVIEYEIVPPTGYTNSQYGTSWTITNTSIISSGGANLPGANITLTNPSGSGAGKYSINPPAGFTDSSMTLAVTVAAQGCDTVFYRSMFFAPRPVATFNAPASCDKSGVQFVNTSVLTTGSVKYLWEFGDGTTSVLINPTHVYPTYGTYTAKLTATSNYGYVSTVSHTVTVYENPQAEFGSNNVCEGSVSTFSDGSIIPAGTPSYQWNFGDGSAIATGANPTHQYTKTGVYEVSMIVTANGCSSESKNFVTYAPRAVPNFTPSAATCNSEDVVFTNSSTLSAGNMGYSWDFGDNTTGTALSPSHRYTASGTINIVLTVTTDLGCINTISKQITLTEAPIASFATGLLCDKNDVDFTNSSFEPAGTNTSYEWKFSDGPTYTTMDVSRSFPSLGTYNVTMKAFSDNGCSDEVKMTISVDELPSAQFYANDICEGNDMKLMNASTGNMGNFSNAWDFGTAGTSTDMNPTVSLPVGATDVTLVVTTPSGCESTMTRTVNVKANPTVSNTIVTSGVKGDGTYLVTADVTPANANYVVFWGDGGRSVATAVGGSIAETYTYLTDGKYTVCINLESNGCLLKSCDQSANVTRTGLMNISNGSLNVYPNPSNGVFNLDLSDLNTENIQVEVYSANGQLINGNVNIAGNAAQLDLSTAAAGVYLVKVHTESGVYTARITLNK